MRRRGLAREVLLATLLGVVLLALLGAGLALRALVDINGAVERSDRARLALEHLVSTVVDAETSERGYLLTGDPAFYDAAERAASEVPARIAAVEEQMSSTPEQRRRLATVRDLSSLRLRSLQTLTTLHRKGASADEIAPSVRSNRILMARLRGVVEEMKTEERSVDRSREREERLRSSFLQGLLLVATVALGALGAGLWFRRRSSLRMEKAHAERQQLVDQLKRLAQENLETVRFAERFVGVLGHDLRNPLSAIRMTSDRARRALGGRVDTRFLERIAAATDRANGMVEQLLDLTRSRLAGGIPLDPRAGNLAEVVLAVVDELRATYPNQTVACDVTAEVIGRWDLDRVAQILSNLVGNALKHGDPAEPVTVTLRADDKAVLEVHNRGRPIPAAELPHLFEPYYRGSSDAPRSGLGLGLFIANQIAIAHGGSIEVTSSESNGTAFTLFLPLSDEASLAAADISGLRSGRGVGERRASPR